MTTLTCPHPAISFLIETGTLLHFPDTSHGLRTLYFLCPVWLSECLERIMHLKSSRSLARNGVIRAEDLRVSWDLVTACCRLSGLPCVRVRVSAIVANFLSWRVPHRCCWSAQVSPTKLRSSTSSSLPSLRLRSLWPTTGRWLALATHSYEPIENVYFVWNAMFSWKAELLTVDFHFYQVAALSFSLTSHLQICNYHYLVPPARVCGYYSARHYLFNFPIHIPISCSRPQIWHCFAGSTGLNNRSS